MQDRESAQTLTDFYNLIAYSIRLSDLFQKQQQQQQQQQHGEVSHLAGAPSVNSGNSGNSESIGNPAYVFRGLVCYYGKHYVSIFQSRAPGHYQYLLFDDQSVKNIGSWEAVKEKCVKSCYQPVLLLYELEN